MRTILALVITALSAFAQQDGPSVTPGQMAPDNPVTVLLFGDGTTNCGGDQCLVYTCTAYAKQPSFTWSVNQATLTSIVDSSNTSTVTTAAAHGLTVNNLVTISGATANALNGTYAVQTVGSTTTFTITTSGVADATYNTSPLAVTTNAPRTTEAIFDIVKLTYSTAFLTAKQNSTPISGKRAICDNRATSTGTTKTTFN